MRYSFLRKSFLYTALGLLAFYLVTIVYIKFNEEGLIFFPNDNYDTTPPDSSWSFEELKINTGTDISLYGWRIKGELEDSSDAVILYFPGSAGNISWEINEYSVLRHISSAIYTFDYYGFGKSSGIISEKNVLKTAEDALIFLIRKEGISPDRIILYGHQLGVNPVLVLAGKEKVRCVIVESAFTSLPELANEVYPILPLKQVLSIEMDNISAVKKIKCPLLVIHSEEDKVIPYHHSQTLFENAHSPKKLLLLKKGGHQNSLSVNRGLFFETVKAFCGNAD